ncbi:DUF2922 domain-containing protein [Lentibacillus sp. N15]|uniref:DUF2922 domain-containing protein n=1 Tax=Lentibacillus songyuanensis TaxID=3136161 RepID=UPI0031B9C4D8
MKKLEFKFLNEDGKTVTYSLEKPIEPVDPEAVKQAMNDILEQNAFNTSGGELVAIKGARIVDHNVEEIELD